MKRLHAWRAGVAGAAVVAACAFVACSTTLDIVADDAADGGGADGGGADGNADGGAQIAVLGRLSLSLQPARLDLLAGGPAATFQVVVGRSAGDTTVAKVLLKDTTGLTLEPASLTIGPGGDGTVTVTALPPLKPQKSALTVEVSTPDGTVTLLLAVHVAHHYRVAGQTIFAPDTDQTYDVTAWGGGGGNPNGGGGGYASGVISVPKSTSCYVDVGRGGVAAGGPDSAGGTGGSGTPSSGGGGGYSGVHVGPAADPVHALLIAGAGAGGIAAGLGGAGGMAPGGVAQSGFGFLAGGGASAAKAGAAGMDAGVGLPFAGGAGLLDSSNGGGGGGAGVYGGGGGGYASAGGGGSCLVPDGGTSAGGDGGAPANAADPRRVNAGDPGAQGAVLLVPK